MHFWCKYTKNIVVVVDLHDLYLNIYKENTINIVKLKLHDYKMNEYVSIGLVDTHIFMLVVVAR